MPYWLCFQPSVLCNGQCAICLEGNQRAEIHVVEATEQPYCSINGPCAEPQELLGQMSKYFEFGPDGRLKLKEYTT